MPITFLNVAMLAGLAAVALPPLIHLLTRRKFDVVSWGAMQFLDLGTRTRRRAVFDEILLMALRMGLIALTVVALAAPTETAGWLSGVSRSPRHIAVVVDNSASMNVGVPNGIVTETFTKLLSELGPADAVAALQASQRPRIVAPMSGDHDLAASAQRTIPTPRGGCDGPGALAAAAELVSTSPPESRRIVVLNDGQRHGWADPESKIRLDLLAAQNRTDATSIHIFNVAPNRPPDTPRWSLEPIQPGRALAVVGQPVVIRSGLRFHGKGDAPLPAVQLAVDGRPAGPVSIPGRADEPARRPLTVRHVFESAGSHVISLSIGNEQQVHWVVECVSTIPVLIVDGDERTNPPRRGAEFVRDALAPARDPSPGFQVRIVPIGDFRPDALKQHLQGSGVLILSDVARLSPEQIAAIDAFLAAGGGVLVAHGGRSDAEHANRAWHRGSQGWLPAAVGGPAGSGELATATQPLIARFSHPAVELFRIPIPGGLGDVRVPRYRTLTPGAGAAVIASFADERPFLVEKSIPNGRIVQSALPFDDSDRTTLIESPSFVPLVHELATYLAGARGATSNLPPGQPIRWVIPAQLPVTGWEVELPDGTVKPVAPENGRTIVVDGGEPGVCSLRHPGSAIVRYFAISDDAAEADLTPLDDADRAALQRAFPNLKFGDDWREALAEASEAPRNTELGWLVFCLVVLLLCAELWLTRKRALAAS